MLQCGRTFERDDVILLNGTEEEVEDLRSRMEARRQRAKMEKVCEYVQLGKATYSYKNNDTFTGSHKMSLCKFLSSETLCLSRIKGST